MSNHREKEILQSWSLNASPWIHAIKNNEIESRNLITNKAIIDQILSHSPTNVLDVGCGEGWLSHKLLSLGIKCIGFDAIPELIEEAQKIAPENFFLSTYEDFSSSSIGTTFDLAVCNFSLFGDESVNHLFQALGSVLSPDGILIIQTLNPKEARGESPYTDGWLQGSWTGFGRSFTHPAPWYFRTEASWLSLFKMNGYKVLDTIEPLHPETQRPLSLIIVGQPGS